MNKNKAIIIRKFNKKTKSVLFEEIEPNEIYDKNKIYFDWEPFLSVMDVITDDINQKIIDKDKTVIIGIARGGLVPMTIVSNRLNIDYGIIDYQTRDGKSDKPKINFDLDKYNQYFLIEDIVDTGKTINDICNEFTILKEKMILYSLVRYTDTMTIDENKSGLNAFYLNEKIWIVFPWEI